MRILVAEYGVGTGMTGTILLEGRAMLKALTTSFERVGHEVITPDSNNEEEFEEELRRLAPMVDAGLVCAPDETLDTYTLIVEENTANLGCPPESIRLCADKLRSTRALRGVGIPAPRIVQDPDGEEVVVKPRFGCASEDTFLTTDWKPREGYITTEYVEGESLSVSLVVGEHPLPLTINRQYVSLNGDFEYDGGEIPYETPRAPELIRVACEVVEVLDCRGYVGVDIVLGDEPYVVDVNPRPTTSLLGIVEVLDAEIGELILNAYYGGLPRSVSTTGSYRFTKADL